MLIPFDRQLMSLQLYRCEFLDKMKLCSILVCLLLNFLRKNDKFGYLSTILGKSGVMHDLG